MIQEIKNTSHIAHAASLGQKSCVLDIETDTRYYRTSHFKNVRLADTARELIWTPEKESDEYDLLIALSESLSPYDTVLTFSGTGFDIPHLGRKYHAYRLSDPLLSMRHGDLYYMLREYNALLPSRRHRLTDYLSLFDECGSLEGDAQKALFISQIMNLSCLKEGKFHAEILEFSSPETDSLKADSGDPAKADSGDPPSEGVLSVLLLPDLPISFRTSCSDGPFHLEPGPEIGTLLLRIQTSGGSFQMFHSDFENYDYLPDEGYAVHRSLTAYVASDRKRKASRDNCYTPVPCGTILNGDEKTLVKFSRSAIEFLLTKPS